MRALVQRVSHASVSVQQAQVGAIGSGLLVFLGVGQGDTEDDASYLVDKVVNLRVFPNDQGRFDHSVLDIHGELLVVSQFTLYADTRRGRRPSFTDAAAPADAHALYERAVALFRQAGLTVATGQFAAIMQVDLVNDGPVTIWLDSAERHTPRHGYPLPPSHVGKGVGG
ncbi:MAG: D-tyrosyl-tRNA(Tyr) deacylase [Dehalococcoidia bacterium]|nr:D-tyrosyl-tRNA(Tyr) deacylase [Dehalococcoidia bacterium]